MQVVLDAGLVVANDSPGTFGATAWDVRRSCRLSAHDLVRGRPRVQPVPASSPNVSGRSVSPSQSHPTPAATSAHPAAASATSAAAAPFAVADAATATAPSGTATEAPQAKAPTAGRVRRSPDRSHFVVVWQPRVRSHVVAVLVRVQPFPVQRIRLQLFQANLRFRVRQSISTLNHNKY